MSIVFTGIGSNMYATYTYDKNVYQIGNKTSRISKRKMPCFTLLSKKLIFTAILRYTSRASIETLKRIKLIMLIIFLNIQHDDHIQPKLVNDV